MSADLHRWFGMGGVPPHDSQRAYLWEHRLHWVMIGVALLSIPAFLFETTVTEGLLRKIGLSLDMFILTAFSLELLWMLWVTHQRMHYLAHNWLSLLIVISAAASFFGGWHEEWITLARLLRVTMVVLILVRILGSLRNLFSPTAMPYLLGLGMVTMALAGVGFYWLEPTIESYGDGLWLAFTSATTVGYGDFVPTTTLSRLFAMVMVLLGYAIMSMVTASIVAFFIGEDEKRLRRETHHDIKMLREELAQLRADLGKKADEAQPPAK
jgi:voltage-gated potassium channel